MSAGSSPLWTEQWVPTPGDPNPDDIKEMGVSCQDCGWRGRLGDLLLAAQSESDMLYCPVCLSPGWVWA